MDLVGIMLSEISQSDKDKYHMISLMCELRNKINRHIDVENRLMVARRVGVGELDEKGEGIKKYGLVLTQ